VCDAGEGTWQARSGSGARGGENAQTGALVGQRQPVAFWGWEIFIVSLVFILAVLLPLSAFFALSRKS